MTKDELFQKIGRVNKEGALSLVIGVSSHPEARQIFELAYELKNDGLIELLENVLDKNTVFLKAKVI